MSGGEAGGGDPRRQASRRRVIAALREAGPLSRAELARRTALSRATISSIVAELRDAALVVEGDRPADGERDARGRPASVVRLDPTAGAALGIDFGKRHVRVALADLGHQVLAERTAEIDSDHPAEEGMALAVTLVDDVLAEGGPGRSTPRRAGSGPRRSCRGGSGSRPTRR